MSFRLEYKKWNPDTSMTSCEAVELHETHYQRVMIEAKQVYQDLFADPSNPGYLSPRVVSECRTIPLHLAPTQVAKFSLQM